MKSTKSQSGFKKIIHVCAWGVHLQFKDKYCVMKIFVCLWVYILCHLINAIHIFYKNSKASALA